MPAYSAGVAVNTSQSYRTAANSRGRVCAPDHLVGRYRQGPPVCDRKIQKNGRVVADQQRQPVGIGYAPARLCETQNRQTGDTFLVINLGYQLTHSRRTCAETHDGRRVDDGADRPGLAAQAVVVGSIPSWRRQAARRSGVRRAAASSSRRRARALPSGVTEIPTAANCATVSP
jgi:hypothetical protein